mmetsp:Transcript_32571/g.70335  ORF Transcript_32571/g.70335 Transcript_32571/m.70335 type:complete len:87 (-) Transcript_32571:76-336(-)
MLLRRISREQTTFLNDKELEALLSLFPLEAALGQHYVHYSWSDQLAEVLRPLLFSSGFASDADIHAAVDTHVFGDAVDAIAKYLEL